MPELVEYLDEQDRSPFRRWFNRLNREAAAEVSCALVRLELGYRSKLQSVGAGVTEYKINFSPRGTGSISGETVINSLSCSGVVLRNNSPGIFCRQERTGKTTSIASNAVIQHGTNERF